MIDNRMLGMHVDSLLSGRGAHDDFDAAIAHFPPRLRGVRPNGLPYSAWQLLEHLRICQWDLLEYSRDPKHVSPEWPDGLWPKSSKPPSAAAWARSVRTFREELAEMRALVRNPKIDLLAPLRHAPEHTLLREALILADHNSYHVGQLVVVRRMLGAWKN